MIRRSSAFGFFGIGLLSLAAFACKPNSAPTQPALPVVTKPAETAPTGPPLFEDMTARCDINFRYDNGESAGHFAIIESLGGGVALFDYDGDGKLDIFFVGGGRYDGKKVLGNPGRLYRNLGNWKFADVTKKAGLDVEYQYTHGAAAFDYDNDGDLDLVLTGYNRVVLLNNEADAQGNRRFIDVTEKAGLKDNQWTSCAGWGDLDGDGFAELYITRYGDWGFDTNHPTDCTYDGKTRDVCQPAKFKQLAHGLYRNNRNGTFTNVSGKIVAKKPGRGLGVVFVDVNGDCRPDIYVANDTDDNYLFINKKNSKDIELKERGLLAGVACDERGKANGSMGVDAADFDRTGLPSIIVTNYENELPALYQNRTSADNDLFSYASMSNGVSAIGGKYVGWGTGFLDYDLDGWEDLMIVNGHAIRFPGGSTRQQAPVLLRNERGFFKVATRNGGSYFQSTHNARGCALGDLDNDGRIDAVVNHLNEPVSILRNVAPVDGRHWLGIELADKQHRDLVGARVVVETADGKQTRYVKGGASFGCTNDRRLVFGLGTETKVSKVTVYWPSSTTQEFSGLQPDAYWRLIRGDEKGQRLPK